jgi:hypothetical protein
LVEANVSEKRTVSIFRDEVTMLGIRGPVALSFRLPFLPSYIISLIPSNVTSALKMETVRFSETLASTNQSTRRLSPEDHHPSSSLCVVWGTRNVTQDLGVRPIVYNNLRDGKSV